MKQPSYNSKLLDPIDTGIYAFFEGIKYMKEQVCTVGGPLFLAACFGSQSFKAPD
jgi:hypothetical protein